MSDRGDGFRLKADEADELARNTKDQGVRKRLEELAVHFREQAETVEGIGLVVAFELPAVRH